MNRARVNDRSIRTDGVTRRFGDKVALQPLSLDIVPEDGGSPTIVGLLGPNGSGKSTFLRILTGLVPPDAGTAVVAGVPLTGDGTAIRRRVTYMPGELHLYTELRARDHLRFLVRGRDEATYRRAVDTAEELELPLDGRVRSYSHGMKRQLVFAAAMAPDVDVRILDEPTDGLDPTVRREVLDRLEADAARGTTVLLSSHHLGEVDRSCRRLVFMNQGRLVADENAADVRDRASRVVKLTYAADAAGDLTRLDTVLRDASVERAHRDGTQVTVVLKERDPRGFLALLAKERELPAPVAMHHGYLSLLDLYRELYGVEGC